MLKVLKRLAYVILAAMAFIYLALEFGGYIKTSKSERKAIQEMITEAPELPQNFLDVYEKVYPGSLQSTMWDYVFKEGFGAVDFKCPVRDAAVSYCIHKANGSFWNTAFMAFLIEDYATPRQCLQFNLCHFHHNGYVGAEAVSQYCFKKPLKDLTDDEVREILVMYQHPNSNKLSHDLKKREAFYKSFEVLKARYNSSK